MSRDARQGSLATIATTTASPVYTHSPRRHLKTLPMSDTETDPKPAENVPEQLAAPPAARPAPRRVAGLIWIAALIVYAIFSGDRLKAHSPDNHFSYLADSYLHGTLSVRGQPPGGGGNDWAHYGDRWFVAFPSFPAVVYMLPVAVLGRDFPNRAYDVFLAAFAPALLYLLLEKLARKGYSLRSWRENVALAGLFAFGTVYFFSAVQGSVWFTAHLVGCALMAGYVYFGLEVERPLVAGALLGLSFHTRTSTLLGAVFFGFEALRMNRKADAPSPPEDADSLTRLGCWFRGIDFARALRPIAKFSVPVLLAIGVYMVLNKLRFDSWTETGYRYLQIRWQARILRWGLFNYHYLSRNLAVALALLPWMTRAAPYVQISRHGLALWVTTPHYLELARPTRTPPLAWSLGIAAFVIALLDLLYQNSGWVQFGYRFSNDFAILLVALLAVVGRPLRRVGVVFLLLAVLVNAFGAATFDRANNVYQGDNTADGMFQGD